MKRRGLELSLTQRRLVYAAGLALLVSGISWAWIHHLDEAGKADENLVKLKQPLMAVHGLTAMVFVLLLGTLLAGHVRRAWHARKNRKNGVFFLTLLGLLMISGYALYYLGDESWRNACSNFHLWLGVFIPVFLCLHIWLGRRATKR